MNGATTVQSVTLEEPEFNLRDFFNVVARRWRIIVAPFAVIVGAAVGLSLATPPVYRASTTVTTDKSPPVILLDRSGEVSMFSDQPATQAPDVHTLAELIKSDVVHDGAMARLTPGLGGQGANAALASLNVQPIRDTELVRVSIEHTDPNVAADAANAVVDSLIDMNLKARRRRATEIQHFIKQQLGLAGEKLRNSEAELVDYKNRHGDVSLAQETSLTLQKLAELEAKRVDARLPRLESASLVATLQSQLASLEIEFSGLQQQFTEKHPAVISTKAKIEETKRRLLVETTRDRQTEQSRERGIAAAIGQYEDRVRGVPTREAELARLTRNTKEAEQIYLLLSSKFQQAIIAEASIGSAIQVVDTAKAPNSPAKQRARRTMFLGSILGLMFGMAAALFIEQLDDAVRSAKDVEEALGAPVLGAIPLVDVRRDRKKGRRRGSAPPLPLAQMDRSSALSEACRTLRTHVLSALPGSRHNCLLVTSALPDEGKSTVAVNLALALAHADRHVWLVDCDLRRSRLSQLFPEAESPGLAAFLTGDAVAAGVVRPTSHPGLSFVASGPTASNAAELLDSPRLARFIEEARTGADVVLLDSPAVMPATDAEEIGRRVDGVLLVVRAGKTDRSALVEVRHRMERVGARIVGAVLNGAPEGPWRY
jgi:capsular exopolysaccharide synthesis family protein